MRRATLCLLFTRAATRQQGLDFSLYILKSFEPPPLPNHPRRFYLAPYLHRHDKQWHECRVKRGGLCFSFEFKHLNIHLGHSTGNFLVCPGVCVYCHMTRKADTRTCRDPRGVSQVTVVLFYVLRFIKTLP